MDYNYLFPEYEDDLLDKDPLPKLSSVEYLDRTAVDLSAPYSELDSEFTRGNNLLESKSKSKSRKTKSNHESTSTKRTKHRTEVDDSRPESDQKAFERLQTAKHLARIAGRKPLSPLNPTDMASGTRGRFRGNEYPDEENHGQNQPPLAATGRSNEPREQGSLSLPSISPEDRAISEADLLKFSNLTQNFPRMHAPRLSKNVVELISSRATILRSCSSIWRNARSYRQNARS